jgi:hypothetical protein
MLPRKKSFALRANTNGRDLFRPPIARQAFTVGVNNRQLHLLNGQSNGEDDAVLQVEQYLVDHPGSPSAVRRPKVLREGDTFIVLLGRDVQHGIVGLGNTVENALRAFDLQYCNFLRPPAAGSVTAKARAHGGK